MADSFYTLIVEILKAHGFELKRQGKGSHEIWWNPETNRHAHVPRTTRSRHTVNDLFKQTGIDHKI